jgi:hypothetical protein
VYIRVTNFTSVTKFKDSYDSYYYKRKAYTPDMLDENGRKKHKKHKKHKTAATGRKKHKTMATGRKEHKFSMVCSECLARTCHKGWCGKPGTRVARPGPG